jgi:hypothetical protein
MFILSINFDFDDERCHHKPQYHGFLAVAVLLRNSKKITSLMLAMLDIRFLGSCQESSGVAFAGFERL